MVEDSEDDALLLLRALRVAGYDTVHRRVQNAQEMTAAMDAQGWDIVLSDHSMPGFSSREALDLVRRRRMDVPFIIVSGVIGEDAAVEAMRAGAQDYIMKGQLARLAPAIARELREADARRERARAEKALLAQAEEFRIARDIQQRLFPSETPRIEGFDIAGLSWPADAAGGDYFDFIPMQAGRLGIVVADVTGHGIGPALLMSDVRACLRALAATCHSLSEIMTHANRLLDQDLDDDRFITLFLAILDPTDRRLEYLNAGHPPAWVVGRDGMLKRSLAASIPALGLNREDAVPAMESTLLDRGDLVLLLTDGILECASPSGEDFGSERVLQILKQTTGATAADTVRAVAEFARKFAAPAPQQDDITAVVVKAL